MIKTTDTVFGRELGLFEDSRMRWQLREKVANLTGGAVRVPTRKRLAGIVHSEGEDGCSVKSLM